MANVVETSQWTSHQGGDWTPWGGEDGDIQAPTRWDKLVAEFHDIFDPPGIPVEWDTVHQIELLPNAEPHYRR